MPRKKKTEEVAAVEEQERPVVEVSTEPKARREKMERKAVENIMNNSVRRDVTLDALKAKAAEASVNAARKSPIKEASEDQGDRRNAIYEARARVEARREENERRLEFASAWGSMLSAMKEKAIMNGTVASTVQVPLKNTNAEGLQSAVFLTAVARNGLRVMIPFAEIYRDYPIDMSTVNIFEPDGTINARKAADFVRRQENMADKMFGLEIPFIVTYMHTDEISPDADYAIAGSRAVALELIEEANFGESSKNRIAVGDVVTGTITSVGYWGCTMNVGGVDVQMPRYAMTYAYIASPADFQRRYHIGDKIRVLVKDIKHRADGHVDLDVSAAALELRRVKEWASSRINIGEQLLATVTNVRPSKLYPGEIQMVLFVDLYQAPAVAKSIPVSKLGITPKPGDTVRVRVAGISETGWLKCTCSRLHGAPTESATLL